MTIVFLASFFFWLKFQDGIGVGIGAMFPRWRKIIMWDAVKNIDFTNSCLGRGVSKEILFFLAEF